MTMATHIGVLDEGKLVLRVEHLGDQTRLHLSYQNHDLVTVTDAHTELEGGDKLKITPHNPFYFDKAGNRII